MNIVRHQVVGSSISYIDDLSILKVGEFLSGDLFLISQQCLSNVSPDRVYKFNDKVYYNEYRSMKEKYDTLSCRFFEDAYLLFGFKSMAWEDEEHYSLVNHVHNYSKVSCQVLISPKKNDSSSGMSSIVTFNINSKNATLYIPHVSIYEQPRPYIGQLKFLAVQNMPEKPNTQEFYNSQAFDGWVYPDGRQLSSSMFTECFEAFGTSYNIGDETADSFRIPLLSSFIRMKNDITDSNSYTSLIEHKNVTPIHFHNISKLYLSGNMTCDISIGTCDNTSSGPSTHSPNNIQNPDCEASAKLAFNFNNVKTDDLDSVQYSDSSLDVESHPSYNLLPVLMYIGVPHE